VKSVRFSKVVEGVGKPEPYTLWQDPDKDRDFQKAVREQRLITVLQEPASSKTDKAVVGYVKGEHANYLVFPKSLNAFKDSRIVGLKYELLTTPKPKGKPVKVSHRKPPGFQPPPRVATREPAPAPPKPPQPKRLPHFKVTARIIHTAERSIDVEARNQAEARRAALDQLEKEAVPSPDSTKQIRITKVSKT
jgi:hypothetical protein